MGKNGNEMLTLFVGNNDESVVLAAKEKDQSAYSINFNNCNEQHSGVCYTSLADLPGIHEFTKLLRAANVIVYSPPTAKWSHDKLHHLTNYYLSAFSLDKTKKILNFNNTRSCYNLLNLVDQRHSENNQLWVAGCSFTIGVGVNEDQRYGNLLSVALNIPVSTLAYSGSSILWATNQLLNSDIQKGDIVVLSVTSPERFPYYDQNTQQITHVTLASYEKHKYPISKKFLVDFNLTYIAVSSILQVKNFCDKIQAKLVIAGMLPGIELATYLYPLSEYLHLNNYYGVSYYGISSNDDGSNSNTFIDFGTDGAHPGPAMHQWYADMILKKLKELT
jgi:hypothetical protein